MSDNGTTDNTGTGKWLKEHGYTEPTMSEWLDNPPIEQTIGYKKERARKLNQLHDKPYWTFIWEDRRYGLGIVNFAMTKDKAVTLFEKTHPRAIWKYELVGSDSPPPKGEDK